MTANSTESESELASSESAAVEAVDATVAEGPSSFTRGVCDNISDALARRGDRVTDSLAPPCGFVLALQRRDDDDPVSERPGDAGARGLDGASDDALPPACVRSGAERKPMPACTAVVFAPGFGFAFAWFPPGSGVVWRTAPFIEEDCVVIGNVLCMWETCERETAAFHNRGAE